MNIFNIFQYYLIYTHTHAIQTRQQYLSFLIFVDTLMIRIFFYLETSNKAEYLILEWK